MSNNSNNNSAPFQHNLYTMALTAIKPVEQSINHIYAVDVSGSMYGVLDKMRNHIKSKLGLLVKPNDTVSIIYFSSKNQYGVVFEGQKINGLQDLSNIHLAVDRYLQTLALTGFVEPLEEAVNIAKRLSTNVNSRNNINSFIFMTDGYDNQWSRAEIIKRAKMLPEYFASIAFIEYGWYCNRALIAEMAEVSGAAHLFSEDYKDYEPNLEKILQNKAVKRKSVSVPTPLAIYLDNDEVVMVESFEGTVHVPENVEKLYLFEDSKEYRAQINTMPQTEQYVALYTAVHKMKTDLVWQILKSLGDVRLIKMFSNCFSKQEYSRVKDAVKECVFDETLRGSEGVDHNLVPASDAYTVLQALNDLMEGQNFLMTNHAEFSYQRIGAASTQKDLSADKIAQLKEEIAQTKDVAEIQRLAAEIAAVQNWSPTFIEAVSDKGEPILNLVFNESRPNVSIQITKQGHITLSDNNASEFNLPQEIPTHIYRNYTIIKDGILNMKVLPVMLDLVTFDKLKSEQLISGQYDKSEVYLLDLTKLPLINRDMVSSVSAKEFFESHLKLQSLKARQKVFKHYLSIVAPKKQQKLSELYGADAAGWLESIGVKDYGFAPKVTTEKSGDFYYSRELNVKIAGLSSLPTVKAVLDKKAKGSKLNLADKMMLDAITEYETFVKTVENSKIRDSLIEQWLTSETKSSVQDVRDLQYKLNRILYSIVVGQAWFEEFSSLDENQLEVSYGSDDVLVSAVLEEKEIPI